MDRRQQKTRKAIIKAFRSLLEKKRFYNITVQEIIDEADVGRSTFYAHFETKDSLLDAMCGDIFNHIFENDPCPWLGEDNNLEGKLAHILWHIRAENNGLPRLLLSDSGEMFMRYFKEHLGKMFEMYLSYFKADVPKDFLIHHLVGSFSETVRWWLQQGMKTTPETTAQYFMKITEKH